MSGWLFVTSKESPPLPWATCASAQPPAWEVFPDVQLNSPVFQFVPIASAPVRTEERRRSEKKA